MSIPSSYAHRDTVVPSSLTRSLFTMHGNHTSLSSQYTSKHVPGVVVAGVAVVVAVVVTVVVGVAVVVMVEVLVVVVVEVAFSQPSVTTPLCFLVLSLLAQRSDSLITLVNISLQTPTGSVLSSRNFGIAHIFRIIGLRHCTILFKKRSLFPVGVALNSVVLRNMPRLLPLTTFRVRVMVMAMGWMGLGLGWVRIRGRVGVRFRVRAVDSTCLVE